LTDAQFELGRSLAKVGPGIRQRLHAFQIQIMPVTDIRTDRRTAGFTIDSTAHCIASYADAL